MVDLAFLLVTFFMLATTFKTEEPVEVAIPSSTTEVKLPEKDIMTITVAEDGRIFFSLDSKFSREALLGHMARKYGMHFSEEERYRFSLINSFGLPMEQMHDFLQSDPRLRSSFFQEGIPLGGETDQLEDWLIMARVTNPAIRVAIKCDGSSPYKLVDKVIQTLIDNNILRFNLITQKEGENG